jgi:hypothetical protein
MATQTSPTNRSMSPMTTLSGDGSDRLVSLLGIDSPDGMIN